MNADAAGLAVAVTGLNATDNPGAGVAVIRALRSGFANIKIIGLFYENLEPGVYMHDCVDKSYQIPYPAAGATALFDRLKYISQKENVNVLIPNFDAELNAFIKLAPQLRQLGLHTFLPSQKQLDLRDKVNLHHFGKTNALSVPQTVIIQQIQDIKEASAQLDFPLAIKGKFYDAVIVQSQEQATEAYFKMIAKWGLPLIAQQFVKGTEINVAVLTDDNGLIISLVAMRKMYITEKGKAWAGITIADDDLVQLAQKFVNASNWKGAFELELIRSETGELFIIEINPRFPAWIYLAAAAGQNQPEALVRMALGEKIKPFLNYETGKVFIRYSWDLITDINEFQQISAFGESANQQ